MKKVLFSIFFMMTLLFLSSCQTEVLIDGTFNVSLKEGESLKLDITTTDKKGITFESTNSNVVTVSENGTITGVQMGDASIKVTSVSNKDVSITVLVQVIKLVNLTTTQNQIVITEGDEHDVVFESNDDVTFSSSNQTMFTVDSEGVVTAIKEGQATLTITSVNDPETTLEVTVIVRKEVSLTITEYPQELVMGETGNITVSSTESYTFLSENEDVLTVNEEGLVTPVSPGETKIVITSAYDESVKKEITIRIYNVIESVNIEGPETVNLYQTPSINATISPLDAYDKLTWSSSNEDILTIDQSGVITLIATGEVTITATSVFNNEIHDSFVVEVINQIMIDHTVTSGTLDYEGVSYTFGLDVFNNINNALTKANNGTTLLIKDGTYEEDFTIDKDGITIKGIGEVHLVGNVSLSAHQITLSDFNMQGDSSIKAVENIIDITIERIIASQITRDFISLDGVSNITIFQNQIDEVNGYAIKVRSFVDGKVIICKNTISNSTQAISVIPSETHLESIEIKVERNEISHVNIGIEIYTYKDSHAYARFNSTIEATEFLAKSNTGNSVEFTLNHWGMETLDMLKFESINESMLLGHYMLKADIISESSFDPTLPVKIIITNPISEMRIEDAYQFNYVVLPYDLETTYIRWITSAPTVMTINREGVVTALRSGDVTLTVRSTIKTTINATVTVTILTEPGIELAPLRTVNDQVVGSTIKLDATPFPESIKDSFVTFTSSDETLATVNLDGLVSLHKAGIVTITATLTDNPTVTNAFTFEVYDELDDSNLLDVLTKSMVTYTTPHRWTAIGFNLNYEDFKYESVSKYYFGDYTITQKIVPVSNGIRPGENMTPHPAGITQYNPYNVYWVVVHDTANAAPGAGALSHANYLYSNAMAGTVLNTSWHFTIDDKDLYQHLPETERGYHAGDGSVLPGQSMTYLGGGNRNGIGIETGINQDADVYRTWQRTAKFGTDLLIKYNLPLTNMRYHVDFSGKNCPQTMRNAGLVPLFEEMKSIEYNISKNFAGAEISFVSDNPEYVDHTGRVIKMPDRALTVSFTVIVTLGGVTESRVFYSYLPGTVV